MDARWKRALRKSDSTGGTGSSRLCGGGGGGGGGRGERRHYTQPLIQPKLDLLRQLQGTCFPRDQRDDSAQNCSGAVSGVLRDPAGFLRHRPETSSQNDHPASLALPLRCSSTRPSLPGAAGVRDLHTRAASPGGPGGPQTPATAGPLGARSCRPQVALGLAGAGRSGAGSRGRRRPPVPAAAPRASGSRLPLTAAGRHARRTASPGADTRPHESPFGLGLRPRSGAGAVPPAPHGRHLPERGARASSPTWGSRGAARPRGGGRGRAGAPAPPPRRSPARGGRRAPPPGSPGRVSSSARAGERRRGAGGGGAGGARAPRAAEAAQARSTWGVRSPRCGAPRAGAGPAPSGARSPAPPRPRRPPPTLVAPTRRQGLARRSGGAGKSRPPPPTSLLRHGGSRAGAPRPAPRAPRPAPPAARPGRARPSAWSAPSPGGWGAGSPAQEPPAASPCLGLVPGAAVRGAARLRPSAESSRIPPCPRTGGSERRDAQCPGRFTGLACLSGRSRLPPGRGGKAGTSPGARGQRRPLRGEGSAAPRVLRSERLAVEMLRTAG
eukprot:XP_022273679.1 uncharacterized protein LOC111095683 [Canis lupus familiaris]